MLSVPSVNHGFFAVFLSFGCFQTALFPFYSILIPYMKELSLLLVPITR